MPQVHNEPLKVTGENFESEVINSDIPVVVDFWAPWCGPCRAIGPVLEQLASEYGGRVKVAKINVDEETELASAFRITSIPTLAVMRGKEVVDAMIGFGGAGALRNLFEKHAASASQEAAAG